MLMSWETGGYKGRIEGMECGIARRCLVRGVAATVQVVSSYTSWDGTKEPSVKASLAPLPRSSSHMSATVTMTKLGAPSLRKLRVKIWN